MGVMRQKAKDIVQQGDATFSKRFPVLTLWQSIAENFHVMRADFTRVRYMSEEFASYLMTNRPAMAHRDLSNSLSFMLRPRDQQWFHARTGSEKINKSRNNKVWLDWASETQRNAMYAEKARFLRATKEGDKDFCAFGQNVITVEPNRMRNGLLYRCWHLRDVAWEEDVEGDINRIHFNWKPEAYLLASMFPDDIDAKVKDMANDEKKRNTKIECRRVIIKASEYDLPKQATRGMEWVSIYIDKENETILQELPMRSRRTIIPRWETVSGSPIAYSPAAIYGLPDARMLQQITLTLLEAGQKAVDPPMIAIGEAINGGINLYAGGETFVDSDYDERTGEVLRPITMQPEGLQFGANREDRIEKVIADAFFLNKIQLPTISKEMTAYETQRIYEEFIRGNIPLIEPVSAEYNGALCLETFYQARDMGMFGSILDMPQDLRAQDVIFEFDSPLQTANKQIKVSQFQQAIQITTPAAQIDPRLPLNIDWQKGYRDAIEGSGAPTEWILPEDQVAKIVADQEAEAQAQQAAEQVAQGTDLATRVAGAAKSAGDATQSLQKAGVA